ncbi:MAG TPA: endonuclease domain-containing protein [Rhodospirillales bacterium]|nr:endonuclease domain-containing protein [Rhodospirillales bacterium]
MQVLSAVAIGPYIVDFVCREHGLVVEVDGGQHGEAVDKDMERSRRLAAHGFRVLRFWNSDVTDNLEGVLLPIEAALNQPSSSGEGASASERVRGDESSPCRRRDSLSPHPGPLPVGEGEEGGEGAARAMPQETGR